MEDVCRTRHSIYSFIYLFLKILLPRLDVGQESSTVLDLASFSTLIIDVPSPDVTLVLKMKPSEEISFMSFLGYKDYPNDEVYVAKTKMPLENANEGLYRNNCNPNNIYQDVFYSSCICKTM